jgi:hypothetical protein
MTLAFLAKSCQGDRTQEQQSVLKLSRSTVEVHLVWHIYVAIETGRQLRAVVYYSLHQRKSEGPMPRLTNMTTIANKKNHNAQTQERGGAAVPLLLDNKNPAITSKLAMAVQTTQSSDKKYNW